MVDQRNKSKLAALKKAGETYNQVITRLLDGLAKTGEFHYIIYNGLFRINYIINYKDKKAFFLDDQGKKSETLKADSYYSNESIQTAYKYFISAINEVINAKHNLMDIAFNLDVGEVKNFKAFILERVY